MRRRAVKKAAKKVSKKKRAAFKKAVKKVAKKRLARQLG